MLCRKNSKGTVKKWSWNPDEDREMVNESYLRVGVAELSRRSAHNWQDVG